MASHALDQRLFTLTADLTSEQDSVSASDGVNLIDGWLKVIDGHASTDNIAGKLNELRDQLTSDEPDTDLVQSLLLTLADHTSQVAQGSNTQEQTAGKLESLAATLRQLASL